MFQGLISVVSHPGWSLALAAAVAVVGLIGVLAYRRVRMQKLCLDTAVGNMSQGLTMFDKSGTLVLCNQRYIEMYGLSPETIRPGCTVNDIVDHRIATGSLTHLEAQGYVDDRQKTLTEGKTVTKDFKL